MRALVPLRLRLIYRIRPHARGLLLGSGLVLACSWALSVSERTSLTDALGSAIALLGSGAPWTPLTRSTFPLYEAWMLLWSGPPG